jgi:Flp pilus assembly protein TadD
MKLLSLQSAQLFEYSFSMGLWQKLFDGGGKERVDYYEEGLELLRSNKYHEALTSFRLALREAPRDLSILQQMAITYTRIGMTDEALRTYRTVLDYHPEESGANYGMAFLLLKEGKQQDAAKHLRAFLHDPPTGPDAQRHIEHARQTLAELAGEAPAGDVS